LILVSLPAASKVTASSTGGGSPCSFPEFVFPESCNKLLSVACSRTASRTNPGTHARALSLHSATQPSRGTIKNASPEVGVASALALWHQLTSRGRSRALYCAECETTDSTFSRLLPLHLHTACSKGEDFLPYCTGFRVCVCARLWWQHDAATPQRPFPA
jgi:hypothetical protein